MNRVFIVCLFASWLLSGCLVFDDPGGFTTRAQIRADSYVAQEHERTLARMAEAQAKVDAEAARQAGANHRAATWAMILPVLALVVGATVAVCLVLNWRGRIAFEQTRQQALMLPGRPAYIQPAHQVGRTEYQLLRDYARAMGGQLTFVEGKPFVALPSGQRLLIDKSAI